MGTVFPDPTQIKVTMEIVRKYFFLLPRCQMPLGIPSTTPEV